jgi:hypoxanthine phosphoribosyltransferase
MKKIDHNALPKNSEDSSTFEIPSWDQTYSLLLELANAVQKSGFNPDIIVGISRGGLIPARILSDLLEIPKLTNIAVEFYVGVAKTKLKPVITQPVSVSVENKKVLLVDDLADTGKSLSLVNSHLTTKGASEIKIATIYYKPWSCIIPHYYQKETQSWIVFPWERKETTRKIVENYKNEGKSIEYFKEKLISSGLNKELTELFFKEISGE